MPDEFANPVADGPAFEVEPMPGAGSVAGMLSLNEASISIDELADLTFAFQAADMNGDGVLSLDEFHWMLEVMGCGLSVEQTRTIASEAKANFATWLKASDETNVEECRKIWVAFDASQDDKMDANELNAVVQQLRAQGFSPKPVSQADLTDGYLNFEAFCAWFIAQENWSKFKVPKKMRTKLPKEATDKFKRGGSKGPFSGSAATTLLSQSTKIVKRSENAEAADSSGVLSSIHNTSRMEKLTRQAMQDPECIIFAEYVFMIRGAMLSDYLADDTDWNKNIDNMVKLREAFDCADIDGNNELELNELEFVMMSMHPNSKISIEDVQSLWDLLCPEGQVKIDFAQFVRGMVEAEKDPNLHSKFSTDIPNRFELLSLVVDSPINNAESNRLYEKMNPLEKVGVRILRNVEVAAQTASYNSLKAKQDSLLEDLQETLDVAFDSSSEGIGTGVPEAIELLVTELKTSNARNLANIKEHQKQAMKDKIVEVCDGKLHVLTAKQRRSVTKLHYGCVLQAALIGAVFTILPGLFENYLVYRFETDGLIDAYWTCPYETRGPGGRGPEFGSTEWIGGRLEDPFANHEGLPMCPYGTCTSIPANPLDVVNGTAKNGGAWTNSQTELSYDCQIQDPYLEDCPEIVPGDCPDPATCPDADRRALNRQTSCAVSSWRWCDSDLFGDEVTFYCSPLAATPLNSPRLHYWWLLNVIGIVVGVVFELSLLMYTALRSAVLVSDAVGLRLIPLNPDRAFVAEMLVRAAFEMGDPEGDILGVQTEIDDNKKDDQDNQWQKFNTVLSAVWYKGKAVITGAILKQICVRYVTTYDTATWIKPYFGVTVATVVWDTMTCHSIMKDAEVRAIGVTTAIEVFNDIMDTFIPAYESNPSSLSDKARIQLLRAIGVAIVKKGSMFPTMELMLRHALNYLSMKRHPLVAASGVIDNEDDFVADMAAISLGEARAVLCVYMMCCALDGSSDKNEFELWKLLLAKVEEKSQSENDGAKVTVVSRLACQVTCQRFRIGQPVTCELLAACFDPKRYKKLRNDTLKPHRLLQHYWRQVTHAVLMFLVKGRLP